MVFDAPTAAPVSSSSAIAALLDEPAQVEPGISRTPERRPDVTADQRPERAGATATGRAELVLELLPQDHAVPQVEEQVHDLRLDGDVDG